MQTPQSVTSDLIKAINYLLSAIDQVVGGNNTGAEKSVLEAKEVLPGILRVLPILPETGGGPGI